MRITLGIDPGSRVTGYGVLGLDGQRIVYVESGCIRTRATEVPDRLGEIFHGINEVLARCRPDDMAVEQVFMARNADSALKLGQARGAAIVAGISFGLPVAEYAARQVKKAVVGNGAAEKHQIQHMMRYLLNLPEAPPEDAADALAVAMCHINTRQIEAGIARNRIG